MRTILITPTKGTMTAPSIIVHVKDSPTAYSQAISEARKRSRLNDFDGWMFV